MIKMLQVQLPDVSLSGNNAGQLVHAYVQLSPAV